MTDFDIAIVGGGMVGASLALGLAQTSRRVVLIEGVAPSSHAQPSFDERTTALGNGTRRIFQALGVWERMAREATPIRAIHVSDAGRFGFARLRAAEQGIEAFGYCAANRVIGAALWERLEAAASTITVKVPARPESIEIDSEGVRIAVATAGKAPEVLTARLVVAADGAQSSVREVAGIDSRIEDYNQIAVVVNVAADQPHDGTAYERFTQSGPLAVLPLRDGSHTVVWTLTPANAEQVLQLSDAIFLQRLQDRFGWRAGRFLRVGRRATYALKLSRAEQTTAARTVLIGNAAQALHPVAGQGFNLGLRDAAMLAELLADRQTDPGSPALLCRFAEWRQADRRGVTAFTDGLVKLFGDTRPGMGMLRNLGLLAFDLLPPAKSALARVSVGFGGPMPRLARGLPLQ